jgi:hypothetical protein
MPTIGHRIQIDAASDAAVCAKRDAVRSLENIEEGKRYESERQTLTVYPPHPEEGAST